MKLRKKIKAYGDSLIISFTKEDKEMYGIKKGQILDIEFTFINDNDTVQKGGKK